MISVVCLLTPEIEKHNKNPWIYHLKTQQAMEIATV